MKPLMVESASLRAVAAVNGRTRCNVFLYQHGEDDAPLLAEDLNLAASKERTDAIERLPPFYREEAEPLLAQLAAVVAAERARPIPKEQAGTAKPFHDLEPWPDEINGAALLDTLVILLRSYVVLPPASAPALALWLAHTYVTDVTDYTPYVLVTSPVRECGKSTLLELLYWLVFRGMKSDGITAAALYRRIHRLSPTMLLDELDSRLRGDSGEALRGVLNSGFHRGGTFSVCVGDNHEDQDFRTFGPKVLAGIGRVWDTVTSRSFPVRLTRASREELAYLSKIRGDRIDGICLPYRRQLLRWTSDVRERLSVTDAVTPEELGARQSDVWRPLLAIADVAGGHWPTTARTAALELYGVSEEEGDYGLLVLEDVRDLFASRRSENLFSSEICQELAKREDRPWPEYTRGDRAITPRGLARLVGRFGVKPKTVRVGAETGKGYTLAALVPVFRTYLPNPVLSVTSVTPEQSEVGAGNVTHVTDCPGMEGASGEYERGDAYEQPLPEEASA